MKYFYHPFTDKATIFNFEEEEVRHLNVLRVRGGDIVQVINGNGLIANAEVVSINNKTSMASILSKVLVPVLSNKYHLFVSPLKSNERLEWMLEKACEIGVSSINFLICERTEKTSLKSERLKKIVVSACKQSKQYYFPILNLAINQIDSSKKLIAYCDEGTSLMSEVIIKGEDTTIFIGPEGDFTQQEVDLAQVNGFSLISLGESRLRTETAAIFALSSLRFVNMI
jgi:16S rRNA (uracil1498-N3)-methyltransferase